MATSVSASFGGLDLSPARLLTRSANPQRSILPIRREKTSFETNFAPIFSSENPQKSENFSGEKRYERKQSSAICRSAKSDEIFRLIDRRLQTGVHGVRHLFRSNDPTQQGKLSKEAFRRVLTQLCGFLNAEEWSKVCQIFDLDQRDGTITFEEFLSFFPQNEKVKRELSLAQIDRRHSALLTLSENFSSNSTMQRRFLSRLNANFCFSLLKSRCRDPSFQPNEILSDENIQSGVIKREDLKKILIKCQLEQISTDENEFEKLWLKFDPENFGFIRTNVFLRFLDYRRNLADEISNDIDRLGSKKSAGQIFEFRRKKLNSPSNSSKFLTQKRTKSSSRTENNDEQERSARPVVPPPTALGQNEKSTVEREPSSKFRQIVQQHRTMIKTLRPTDEFLPFLDRKVNEGFFCLKTVFQFLDPNRTNFISNEQLVAALNQFEIEIETPDVEAFLKKHRIGPIKEKSVDYQSFLKYFQDRSDSSFLARTLSAFGKEKFDEFKSVEHGIIDLLHRIFLSLTSVFKQISTELDEFCPEDEFFLILKKEFSLADNFQFSARQKFEVYQLLQCSDNEKRKREIPYRKFLQALSKTPMAIPKDRNFEKFEEFQQKSLTPPRELSYIEKTLNDLIRLRMHTFTKAFSRIDQPRTDLISKEQFYQILQEMSTDLSRSEVNLVWSSSGFNPDKSIPFSNLIRQIILFNREENQWMISQLQRSRSNQETFLPTTIRSSTMSTSSRALSTVDEKRVIQPVDCHEIYERILPQIRQNYGRIKYQLLGCDPQATGLIDFTSFLEILRRHSVTIDDMEFRALIRADNTKNGSKVQYPFFIRKFHSDGPTIKLSPWTRVHPIYEQLIHKHHSKNPTKELYDQRTQNPRDFKYFFRLFHSYDKSKKGFLTNDEYYSLLCDSGIVLNKSSEDYYQLFSKYDRHLRDQFDYTDLLRSMILSIMS